MIGTEDPSQQDDDLRRRARQRALALRAWPLIALTLMAVGFTAISVVRHGLEHWWVIGIFFLPVVVLGVMTVIIVRLQRRGHRWFPQPVRLLGADRATRRRVRRMVRKGQLPTEEPDRALALEMVQATDRVRWARWSPLVALLALGVQAFTTENRWVRLAVIVYMVVLTPVVVLSWRIYARAHTLNQENTITNAQPSSLPGPST